MTYMQRSRNLNRLSILLLITAIIPVSVHANSSGPPNELTGAPGEATCTDCHGSFPLNSGPGVFTIDAPTMFSAGETYEITVTLSQDSRSRWGFEITPLAIGDVTITDATNTQLSMTGSKSYVKQTFQGTYNGSAGPAVWRFDWTAPDSPPDEVIFYASGNACNGNGSTSGDYVYTNSAVSSLQLDVGDVPDVSPRSLNLEIYPHPVSNMAMFSIHAPEDGHFSLTLYDLSGTLVDVIDEGTLTQGNHTRSVDFDPGHTGIFMALLNHNGRYVSKPLVILP